MARPCKEFAAPVPEPRRGRRARGLMTLSELSIRRPVFATVLSLLLLIVGIMAALRLSIREYPDVSQPVVSINVNYRGANAAIIETRVTQVIENEVAGLEGVDKLTSQSRDESASVNVQFTADRDVDAAANDVRDRVSRVMNRLPQEADAPQIQKTESGADPVLFVIISSSKRNGLELTDYAERYLVDRISAVPGVANTFLNGARRYAMRIWLDRGATGGAPGGGHGHRERVAHRERRAAGRAHRVASSVSSRCAPIPRCAREEDFRNLVVGRGADGYLVRLGEVATVQLAAENQRSGAATNDGPAIMMPVVALSTANVLEVASAIKKEMKLIQEGLPDDINVEVNIDNSVFILESMKKVLIALCETLAIVLVVIFLFLGSLRATLIPAATIPVSIFAAAMVMLALGLFHQHADAAGRGAGHRPGGRRRHRGAGKHRAPHRARGAAAARGHEWQPRDQLRGGRDDHGAGGGVPADFLPAGQCRPPVQRVRHHGRRGGGVFGHGRADVDADDDFQAVCRRHQARAPCAVHR